MAILPSGLAPVFKAPRSMFFKISLLYVRCRRLQYCTIFIHYTSSQGSWFLIVIIGPIGQIGCRMGCVEICRSRRFTRICLFESTWPAYFRHIPFDNPYVYKFVIVSCNVSFNAVLLVPVALLWPLLPIWIYPLVPSPHLSACSRRLAGHTDFPLETRGLWGVFGNTADNFLQGWISDKVSVALLVEWCWKMVLHMVTNLDTYPCLEMQ